MTDSSKTFKQMSDEIQQYLAERGWDKLPSKDLAISISLEAGELLEHYQWSHNQIEDKQSIEDELADILIYCFEFAQMNNIDISAAMAHKLDKVKLKYPAKLFKEGLDSEAAKDTYNKIKQQHRTEQA